MRRRLRSQGKLQLGGKFAYLQSDENWEAFRKAFDESVDAANAWHVKKDKPYIRWKLPDHPPPDLDLEPR